MSSTEDTIAAIATASGEGGISVVRISGPESLRIADGLFAGTGPKPSERPSHVILHGRITSPGGEIDEVLLLIMRAPHSYTREDVVEIQGHGGPMAARRILRRVLDAGARPAEPGEFTKRAFLNGRIDLLQAEAVLDLVRARSDRAAAAAVEQLEGGLSVRFNHLYDKLLSAAGDLEATLDFTDEDLPAETGAGLVRRIRDTRLDLDALLSTWGEGLLLREGAVVVITGRPNVGKSTLLNALLGHDRAIVSQHPGTTRDTIEEGLVIDGIPARLVDTAGLRDSECEVEREGIRRTRTQIGKADVQLYMIDASQQLEPGDREHLRTVRGDRAVIVLNKTDLGEVVRPADLPGFKAVPTCLLRRAGLEDVRAAMVEILESGLDMSVPPHAVISERHRQLLLECGKHIDEALALLDGGATENTVLAAEQLRAGLEVIGTATGRVYQEELLSNIFSRFCIGK